MSPLIGNPYVVGDTTGNFKKLDNLSSYTLTFDPSVKVSLTNDTITEIDHRFVTGQRVTYTHGGGSAIGGLTSGSAYYIVNNGADTIKLAATYADALLSNTINLTSIGSGTAHTINLAFDGINTRFRATYSNGIRARITNASQLTISINGVLQQPFETATPTDGYGLEHPGIIVFSVAPGSGDVFWGNIIANNFPTYDITDNKVDNFTGNGSQTEFTLSRTVPNNESLLVTIDGVTQYPSDGTTTRAYTIYDSILTFSEAPANGAVIQARHIGFAGAVTSAVTGFYGRTGNVGLSTGDNINVASITATTATFSGNVSIAGTLTYEDVTNIDSIGVVTARSDVIVGGGVSIVGSVNATGGFNIGIQSGGINITTGVVTALNFVGAGNTFKYNSSTKTVDISIQGGGGGGTGVSSTGILTCRGIANSSVITESILMDDFYNEGTNYGMIGPIEVSIGATITVGLGVSYAIL